MAYRSRARRSAPRRRSSGGSYRPRVARRPRRAVGARRSAVSRRGVQHTVRLVIEQPVSNPVARPDALVGLKPADPPKKARF